MATTTRSAADIISASFKLVETAVSSDPRIAEQNRLIQEQKRAFEERIKAKKEKTPHELVVDSWITVTDIVDYEKVVGEILFRRIFEIKNGAIRLFPFGKKYTHDVEEMYEDRAFLSLSTSVIGTITAAVGLLDKKDMETFSSIFKDLGACHFTFKFDQAKFDILRDALMFTLEMALDADFSPKVKKAWGDVYALATAKVMQGAEEALAIEKEKMLEPIVSTESDEVEKVEKVESKPVTEAKADPVKVPDPVKVVVVEPSVEKKKKSAITWMLKKEKKNSKSGLTYASKNGIVALRAVEGRALQKTNLTVGLQVLKIGGKEVKTATEAVRAFASAPVGNVKIMTNGSHHTAKKMTPKDKAGFAIQPYHLDKSLIEIYKVNPAGMFPDLIPGHLLWSINGKRIVNVQQGIKLLQTRKVLMLVVVDPADLGGIKASDVQSPKGSTPVPKMAEPAKETAAKANESEVKWV